MYKIFIEYFRVDPDTGERDTVRTREKISGTSFDMQLINPSVDLTLNKAGKAEFTVPAQHPFYSDITPMTTNVEIDEVDNETDDSSIIFFGRVSSISRGWNNEKKVVCEGALAFFNDTIQRWKKYPSKTTTLQAFFQDVLTRHNDQMEDNSRKILFGTMNLVDPLDPSATINSKKVYRLTQYETTFDVLTDMCVNSEGGYLFVRRENESGDMVNYIDWISELDVSINQPAKFGLNLLDLDQDFDSDELYTALLPLGANYDSFKAIESSSGDNPAEKGWYVAVEEGYKACTETSVTEGTQYYEKREKPTTIKSVNDNLDYIVDEDAVAEYGFILKTKRWDDVSDKSTLKKKAREWMSTERFNKLVVTCDVADLHNLKPEFDPFILGKVVEIVSPPHGIAADNPIRLPISEIRYDLNTGKKEVTIGTQPQVTLSRITKKGSTKEVRVPDAKYDCEDTPES